jgi:ABC-type multidrug transport system fused ATPase/permease subunit
MKPKLTGWQVVRRLLRYVKPYWMLIAFSSLCLVVGVGVNLAPPLVWKFIVDAVIVEKQTHWLMPMIVLMIAIHLLGSLLRAVRGILLGRVGQCFLLDLRTELYAKLQRQSLSYFHNRKTGDLTSRVVNDVDVLQDIAVHGTDEVIDSGLNFIGVCAIIVALNWRIGLLILLPVFAVAVSMTYYNTRIRPLYRAIRDRLGDISARLTENLNGIHVIKAFAKEPAEAGRFRGTTQVYFDENMKAIRTRSIYFPATMFIGSFSNVVMIGVGAWFVLNQMMTLGTLVAYRGYWWQLMGPLFALSRINDMVQRAIAAGSRVFELLDEPEEIQDAPDATELDTVRGDVQFNNISFAYRERDDVLRNISLHIKPGQSLAIVGPSGSGKSTILSLIPRFYDPQEGAILVDGHDLRTVTQQSLRSHIAVVLQDTFLFNETVLFNIKYARPKATMEEVIAAAQAANAHGFIEELPQGYDTEVGERGVKLSGGQKQRISIARAFLANPQILILDEATSAVEPESEFIIQEALERLMKGRTTFIVSHRLSMVRGADNIAVIDGGRIIELGNHAELMQNGGLYAEMYRMQMGEEWTEAAVGREA